MPSSSDHLYLRFRYGKHVVFLSVNPLSTQAATSARLLAVLRSRYPNGELSTVDGRTMSIVASTSADKSNDDEDDKDDKDDDDDAELEFAVLKVPNDPAQGWKLLGGTPHDPLVRRGDELKDGTNVAFRLKGREDDGWDVDFPTYLEDTEWEAGGGG